MKIGFIGLGNMGSAMIGGILKNEIVTSDNIIGADHSNDNMIEAYEKFGINCVKDNAQATKQADIIILSVKPQVYEEVIKEIKDCVDSSKIIVSIAPGKTLQWLSSKFEKNVKLVRCMPNTPALVLEGCTGVCKNEFISEEEFELVKVILAGFSGVFEVKESQMDAVVAVSGSSPAYVFMMIDAMADAAVKEGLSREVAIKMAAKAVLGSAKMVLDLDEHPAKLKDMVCSPAGTTIEAVKVLEEKGFRASLIDAMSACADKSRSL